MYGELYHALVPLYFIYEQYGFYLDVYALFADALAHFEQPEPPSKKGQGNAEVETRRNLFIGLLQMYFAWCHLRTGRLAQVDALYEAAWSRLQGTNSPAAALCAGYWGTWKKVSSLRQSAALLTECIQLAQKHGLTWTEVLAQQTLGETNLLFGHYDEAEAQVAAGFAVAAKMQWPRAICSGYKILGRIHLLRGSYHEAEAALQEAIALTHQHHFDIFYIESTLALGEVYRLQDRFAEAKACFAECRKFAEKLGVAAMFTSAILWEEGNLAEQRHAYTTAKACFTQSLARGLPNWWAHALPTLGWALIGIGDLDEAQTYFQTASTTAEAQGRNPLSLDAQAGLAYIAAQRANLAQCNEATHRATVTEITVRLRRIYQHPAGTQQTRDRIARTAQELGVAEFGLAETSHGVEMI